MPVKDTSGSVVRTLRPPANPAWQNEVGGVVRFQQDFAESCRGFKGLFSFFEVQRVAGVESGVECGLLNLLTVWSTEGRRE